MSELCIDFGYDDNVKRELKHLTKKLEDRAKDYRGVINKLNDINSNTGNLVTANAYIKKKADSLDTKRCKLENFSNGMIQFNDYAQDADKRVANKIKESRNDFIKREHIPGVITTAILVALKTVVKAAGKIVEVLSGTGVLGIIPFVISKWDTIVAWYEENKCWVDVFFDVIAIAGAIATIVTAGGPLAVLAVIVGMWKFAKGLVDLHYDIFACEEYLDGNIELSKRLSSLGMEDTLETAFGEELGGKIYTGMETVSAVYGALEFGRAGVDLVKGGVAGANGTGFTTTDGNLIPSEGITSWGTNHILKNTIGININPKTIWDNIKTVNSLAKPITLFVVGKPVESFESVKIVKTWIDYKKYVLDTGLARSLPWIPTYSLAT